MFYSQNDTCVIPPFKDFYVCNVISCTIVFPDDVPRTLYNSMKVHCTLIISLLEQNWMILHCCDEGTQMIKYFSFKGTGMILHC